MKNSAWSDIASLEACSRALRLASAGLQYPDAAWRERLSGMLGEAEERDFAGLQAEHFRLFGPAPECPLELACHLGSSPLAEAGIMAQISGFHLAFGVRTRPGLRPDNLPACLEFLAILLAKYLNARAKGLSEAGEVTRKAAEDYAREFLGPGLGAFLGRLRQRSRLSLYIELSELGREAVGKVWPDAGSAPSRWTGIEQEDWGGGTCGAACPVQPGNP